ncbi:MAG: T9SS type A sorting domain-containing protein [Bacteroidota bacterium]
MLRLLASALTAVVFLASAGPALAQTCTTSWQPDGGGVWTNGDWADGDRWDNGVPTASDVACILGPDGRASFTVTVSEPREVAGLVVGNNDPFGAVALQLDAELTVTGNGRLFGRDRIDGDLTLGGDFVLDDGDLARGGGTVTVTGSLTVRATGEADNGFRSQIGASSNSPASTLVVDGGRLAFEEATTVSSALDLSGGTVAVRESARTGGTLVTFRNGGSLQDLALDTEAETQVTFRGAFDIGGTFGGTADGDAEFSRFSTVEVDATGVEFAVGGDRGFALSNDDSGSASQLEVTTAGGDILNSGLLRIARATTLRGPTLRTTGTTQFDANTGSILTLADGSDLVVEETGTIPFLGQNNVQGTAPDLGSPEGEERVVVRGRLLRDRSDNINNATSIRVPVDVEGGTVEASSAVFFLSGGGRLRDATLIGGQDAQLVLQNLWEAEGTLFGSALTDTRFSRGETSVLFTAGFRRVTELRAVAPVTLAVGGDGLTLGVTGGGTTELTASAGGRFVNTGTLNVASGATLRGATLRNEGAFTSQISALTLAEAGRLVNPAGETVTLLGALQAGDDPGTFQNEGLARIAGSVSFNGQLDARPGSELRVLGREGGRLNASGVDAGALVREGSFLTGSGSVGLTTGLELVGVLSPGAPGMAVDTLRFGAFAMANDARLAVDLGPGGADRVEVVPFRSQDRAVLAGAIDVRLADGFVPTPGDVFEIVRRTSGQGRLAGGFDDRTALTIESADLSLYPALTRDAYTLTAATGIPTISGTLAVAPQEVRGGEAVELTLTGTGFAPDVTASLECVTCFDPDRLGTLPARIGSLSPTEAVVFVDLSADGAFGEYEVVLRDPRGGEARVSVLVNPSDLTVSVEAVDAQASEEGNDPGVFAIRLNRPTLTPITVPFELDGTADLFLDYISTERSQAVTILARASEARISVVPVNDDEADDGETIRLRVLPSDDYQIGTSLATVTIADGPPSTALAAFSVSPRAGGAGGVVTLSVGGQGFAEDATVSLVGGGAVSTLASAVEGRNVVRSTVDLTDATLGVYDVVVTSGGATMTLPRAFRVEESEGAEVWVSLVGRETVRSGRPATFALQYGNNGNVNAEGAVFYVRGIPLDAIITYDSTFTLGPIGGIPGEELEPPVAELEDEKMLILSSRRLSPGTTTRSEFRITSSTDYSLQLLSYTDAGSALSADDFAITGSPSNARSAKNEQVGIAFIRAGLLGTTPINSFPARVGQFVGTLGTDGACTAAAESNFSIFEPLVNGSDNPISGWDVKIITKNSGGARGGGGHTTLLFTTPSGRSFIADNYTGAPQFVDVDLVGDEYFVSPNAFQVLTSGPYLAIDGLLSTAGLFTGEVGYELYTGLDGQTFESCPTPEPEEEKEVQTVASFDPNDKLGPSGAGPARFTRSTRAFPYTIRFENLDTATAPAAEVVVVDTLDLNVFDPATLTLGDITFGERTVPVPPGLQTYTTRVDLRPEQDLEVVIAYTFEPESGILTARFTSLDPATGLPSEDPFAGFLPPNTMPPEGEGSISLTITPREGLGNGTVLQNEARIFFDANEPIDTPPWVNTLDLLAPTSTVTALGSTVSDTTFTVSWDGSDAGAGISSYSLFASEDGGPFQLALLNTPLNEVEFTGRDGSTYGFFVVARDFAGNREDLKTEAEATTMIVVNSEEAPHLPQALTLDAPYPNPTRASVTFRYSLPQTGEATVRVLDLLGREVAVIAEGETAAGWHESVWRASGVAAGVYLVEIRTSTAAEIQRLTVVR